MSKDKSRAGAWTSHHLVTVRCAVLARILLQVLAEYGDGDV